MWDGKRVFTVPQDLPAEQSRLLIVDSLRELQKIADGVFRKIEGSMVETAGFIAFLFARERKAVSTSLLRVPISLPCSLKCLFGVTGAKELPKLFRHFKSYNKDPEECLQKPHQCNRHIL